MKLEIFIFRAIFVFTFIFCILPFSFSQFSVQTFPTLSGLSIRALHAVSDTEAWFAANRGVWGYTEDAGITWKIDSIKVDDIVPEFRGMEVLNDSTVLLMGIASPGFIFKTTDKGKTWKTVYRNDHKDFFFDSMKFMDKKKGLALGDPIEGKMQVIITDDGGNSWKSFVDFKAPEIEEGEAFFAASNTCFDFHNHHCWVATGGKNSRVLYSDDGGESHLSFATPLPEGEQMTGIYSVDFFDASNGVVAGGNYDKADTSITSLAFTNNGGKTWTEIKMQQPVFGSCVQFRSRNELWITGKAGTFQYDLIKKSLIEINDLNGNEAGFHTLRISPSKKVIWLAGSEGRIGRIDLSKK